MIFICFCHFYLYFLSPPPPVPKETGDSELKNCGLTWLCTMCWRLLSLSSSNCQVGHRLLQILGLMECGMDRELYKLQTIQCVANIRIFEYIRISYDEYIHIRKYSYNFYQPNVFRYSLEMFEYQNTVFNNM